MSLSQVQHQYCLTDEQGPAHRKVFFVKLKLGDEEFDASGASIKKAQHAAAATALESTKLPRPPPKRLSMNAAVPVSSRFLLLLHYKLKRFCEQQTQMTTVDLSSDSLK